MDSNERGNGPGAEVGAVIGDGMVPDRRTYRTELLRADVAARDGYELGDAPGGGPASWELAVDAARVAVTDEPMTDHAAVAWARRTLGEDVVFLPARLGGGYWVAHPDPDPDPDGGSGGAGRPGNPGFPGVGLLRGPGGPALVRGEQR